MLGGLPGNTANVEQACHGGWVLHPTVSLRAVEGLCFFFLDHICLSNSYLFHRCSLRRCPFLQEAFLVYFLHPSGLHAFSQPKLTPPPHPRTFLTSQYLLVHESFSLRTGLCWCQSPAQCLAHKQCLLLLINELMKAKAWTKTD